MLKAFLKAIGVDLAGHKRAASSCLSERSSAWVMSWKDLPDSSVRIADEGTKRLIDLRESAVGETTAKPIGA